MSTRRTEVAPDPQTRRRRRAWRIARNALLAVLGAAFAAWLLLYVTKGRFLRGPFEAVVGRAIGRTVAVGGDFQLYFDPLDVKFVAERIRVANPGWATRPHLFAAERVETRVPSLSLLWGRRRMRFLDLVGARLDLEWDAGHRRNTWTFSQERGEPFAMPLIDRATVADGRVRYLDPRLRVLVDVGFQTFRAGAGRIGDALRFSGGGRALESPFTITGSLLSPDTTAANGENRLAATARFGRDTVEVAGTLPSATRIEGVPLRVAARGRDLSELLSIIGVAVPETRAYALRGRMVKRGDEYRFTRVAGRFGESDVAGRFTVRRREPRIHIDADLATRSLDIADVASFTGYNPDLAATRGAVAAAGGDGRLLPDARLRVEALRRFDADVRYRVSRLRSRRVPIGDIDLTLDLTDRVLTLSPLTFEMARGRVASDVVIDARGRLVRTRYDVRLAPTPMARLLSGWGVEEAGTSGTIRARARLVGVGDTVRRSLATANGRIAVTIPAGTMWTRNAQLSELDLGTFAQKMFERKLKEPIRINCGLLGFTVRNGVAAADPILIDTTKNVVLGRGGFSFRDERVDLAVRADGKRFSLFSGQSPVAIGGTFANPRLDVVSPELVGRAGAGLGLAVVAAPPAALLAFVDVGDAKSAACGPVLAGATAAAQRTRGGERRDDVGNGSPRKSEDGGRKRKKFLGIF